MEANAITLKSGKESISVDGETFIKSCPTNKWTHIIKLTFTNPINGKERTEIGKSSSLKGAEKWSPFPLCDEFSDIDRIKEIQANGVNGSMVRIKGAYSGLKVFRVPYVKVVREIVEIKR